MSTDPTPLRPLPPITKLVETEGALLQEIAALKQARRFLTKRADRGLAMVVGMRLRQVEAELDYVRWAIEADASPALRQAGYVPF
jgi:hypothetical protein